MAPWLEYWGSNANALPRSTLYTRSSPLSLPWGTMFPRKSSLVGDMAAPWASDMIARHPSRGLGSTRLSIKHMHLKDLSERDRHVILHHMASSNGYDSLRFRLIMEKCVDAL